MSKGSTEQKARVCVNFDLDALYKAYFALVPDYLEPEQGVEFGTSGHRGSSFKSSFNEAHILAITQAVCDFRKSQGVTGPLFLGKDTHALSFVAFETAVEVLAANGVQTLIHQGGLPTPTPVISHSILAYNVKNPRNLADGIVITPSHNPPEDGGFKYNENHGGPAETNSTRLISARANELLAKNNQDVKRISFSKAKQSAFVHAIDLLAPYVDDLPNILDMHSIANSGLVLGVDPLGGASLPYWERIAEKFALNLTVVNKVLDPCFAFMPPDHDGKIRMDCSSPMAMRGLVSLANRFDLAFANDPDADRHGIVTSAGLMNTNHYLSVATWYLLQNRPSWNKSGGIGKTVVTTQLIDRICKAFGRKVYETPVGFKWFVQKMQAGELPFICEESAGGSFVRFSGLPWSTDKDGLIMDLLAAEIMAKYGKDPAQIYEDLTTEFGKPYFKRIDAPASFAQKQAFKKLVPSLVEQKNLAGDKIIEVSTTAKGNGENIGGLKVVTEKSWFAARPSGTENIYKVYAESFVGEQHLEQTISEAKILVGKALA